MGNSMPLSPHTPKGFTSHDREGLRRKIDMRPCRLCATPRVVLEHLDATDDVYHARFLNGFARIECLQFRKLLISLSQKRRRPSQNCRAQPRAFPTRLQTPHGLRPRRVDKALIGNLDITDHMPVPGCRV